VKSLLGARVAAAKRDAAIDAMRRANPALDFDRLHPGSVVFVPEEAEAPEEVSRAIQVEREPDVYRLEGQTADDTAYQDSPSERGLGLKKSLRKRKHAPANNLLATGPDLFDQGPPFFALYWHYAVGGLCVLLAIVLLIVSLTKEATPTVSKQNPRTPDTPKLPDR
jgi:hypothetical protein